MAGSNAQQQQQQEAAKRAAELAKQQQEAAKKAAEAAKRAQEEALRQQQEAAKRAAELLRQQQEAAKRAAEAARKAQEAALRQQQEAAKRAAELVRQQQEAAKRAAEQAKKAQEAALRQQQEAARRLAAQTPAQQRPALPAVPAVPTRVPTLVPAPVPDPSAGGPAPEVFDLERRKRLIREAARQHMKAVEDVQFAKQRGAMEAAAAHRHAEPRAETRERLSRHQRIELEAARLREQRAPVAIGAPAAGQAAGSAAPPIAAPAVGVVTNKAQVAGAPPPPVALPAPPSVGITAPANPAAVALPTAAGVLTRAANPARQIVRQAGPVADAAVAAVAPAGDLIATGLSDDAIAIAGSLGLDLVEERVLPATGAVVSRFRLPAGMPTEEARAKLKLHMPLASFAPVNEFRIEPPAPLRPEVADSDKPVDAKGRGGKTGCSGSDCFAPELIHWSAATASCARAVRVGIIDTSFDITHPAFDGLVANSGEFLSGARPSRFDWHGTAVLSLLAGDAESGTPGLIPNASFLLATAFSTDASGIAATDTIRLLGALDWLEQLGVEVVNMSFTGPRDQLVEAAIKRMQAKGVIFVAAAGNQGPTAPPSYPAAYANVIAVTAINRRMESYRHANRGNYVDVSAPGVEIWTALPDAREGQRTGTSFAAPFVTAVIAASQAGRRQRAMGEAELLAALPLQDLGPPGPDPIYGRGLVRAPATCQPKQDGIATRPVAPMPVVSAAMLPPQMGVGAPLPLPAAPSAWRMTTSSAP